MLTWRILRSDCVDSTNTRLRELAERGAPEGTVVTALAQSAGRGTGGRSFFSPAGEGLYLSVLLRPRVELSQLLTLTGRAAVAVRRGVERACGAPCAIKWLNDLRLNGKKLCGILTELSPGLDFVIVGIGINLTQSAETFAAQGLGEIATSLAAEGYPADRERLTACVLEELEAMYRLFPAGAEQTLREYRAHCLNLGQRVIYWENGSRRAGTAEEIDGDFSLIVDGHAVRAGTVFLEKEMQRHEQ